MAILTQGLVISGAMYLQSLLVRSNLSLVSVASSFIAESPDESLDRMLGTLLGAGNVRNGSEEPGGPLFDLLDARVPASDFEFRRRVSETLPVLAIINPGRAYAVAYELRSDFDSARWVSDVRRRVLEALYVPVGGHKPFAKQLSKKQREELLLSRAGDNVFVAMAALECIHAPLGRSMPKDLAAKVIDDTRKFGQNHFTEEQRAALESLIDFWVLASNKQLSEAEVCLRRLLGSSSPVEVVVGARAVVTWAGLSRESRMRYIREVQASSNNWVRRVIAREVSLRFLLQCLNTRGPLRVEAEEVLQALAKDPDDIIRTTMMDVIEFGYIGPDLVKKQLCDSLESLDAKGILTERIKRARKRG